MPSLPSPLHVFSSHPPTHPLSSAGGKVSEQQLIQMLESVSNQVEKKATKVIINRRRYMEEDDDDNDDDLL